MNASVVDAAASPPPAPRRTAERVVFALAVAAVFAFLTWADATGLGQASPAMWLLPVAIGAAAGGADEMRGLAGRGTAPLPRGLAVGGSVAVVIAAAWGAGVVGGGGAGAGRPSLTALGCAAGAVLAGFITAVVGEVVRFRAPGQGGAERLATLAMVFVWVALPVACLVALRVVADGSGDGRRSILPLASLVAIVKAGDAAAYCVGSSLGRWRMAPALSPGKTWEGGAASLVASLVVAWAMLPSDRVGAGCPWGGWLVYGAAVGVAGMVGDLVESLLKREAGCKDSGRSLGPLGGVLDLVDSLLVAAPVAWLLWVAGTP